MAVQAVEQIHEQNLDVPIYSVSDMDGTIAPGKPNINQWEFFVRSAAAIRCQNRTDDCQEEELTRISGIYQQFQAPFLDWAYRMRDVDLAEYYSNEARVSQDIEEILEWSADLYDFMRNNYFEDWYQEFASFLERNPMVRNYLYVKYEEQMRNDDRKVTYIGNQHLAEFLTEQHIRNTIWHIATYKLRMKLLEAHFSQQEQAQTQATIQDLVTQQMLMDTTILGQDHFNSMSSEQQQEYRRAIKKLVEISQKSGGKVIINSFGVPELVVGYLLAALGQLEVSDKEDTDKNGLPENIIILGPNIEEMIDIIWAVDSLLMGQEQLQTDIASIAQLKDKFTIFSPTSFPVATSKAIALHTILRELGLINTDENGNLRVQGILAGLGDSSTYDVFLWYILGLNTHEASRTTQSDTIQQGIALLIANKGGVFV